MHWPHAWYWAAHAYTRGGQRGKALEIVEDGLSHQPGSSALRDLKLQLLAALVSADPALATTAKPFWVRRLEEEPLDFDTRLQLVRQEAREGNSDGAWTLLDECFAILGAPTGRSLASAGFSLEEVARALRYLPQYIRFREHCPVPRYWEQADPLYDLPFPPPESSGGREALFVYSAIAFGLGCEFLEGSDQGKRGSVATLRQFFDSLREAVQRALVRSAAEFAPLIPPTDQGAAAVAEAVNNVLMFLGLLALREFGSQRGWILSQFRVAEAAMGAAQDGNDENLIQADVVSEALCSLNAVAHFLPS